MQEFLLLGKFSGLVLMDASGDYPLYPFAPLDPVTPPPAEPAAIRFIRLVQALSAAGLRPVQALYLIWNQDISGKSAPSIADITGLARTLRADFAAVEAQFTLVADPDGTIAKGLMALAYGTAATDFFFGLLNNTLSVSVAYSNPPTQPTLPQPVIDASKNRLSYDDLRKQLTYTGVLDSPTKTAIDQAITNNGNYAPLHAAITALASANQQSVGPFFSTYPELQPLYGAYVASSDPPAAKRTALLANFLPSLKHKRKQEQALASVTSAAGTDPSFADTLLQDATILHAASDQTLAAIADLTAIEAQGLSAQFYLNNTIGPAPDQSADSVSALSYSQIATIGGTVQVNDVLTTTINGVAVPYTVTANDSGLPALAANIAAAINATMSLDPATNRPLNQIVSAQVSQVSQVNSIVIMITGIDPSGANRSFSLTCSVSPGARETYTSGSQLPAGQGGGSIAGVWSGYINAPQDGFYDIAIATDTGATVSLSVGRVTVPLTPSGNVWGNQSSVSLTAGVLTPIVLTVTSVEHSLSVSWKSLGLGWQVIPGQYLYSATLIDRLQATYVRFLKATSLATALSLTANEIAWLGTTTNFGVNTIDGHDKLLPGNSTFTPASMANITKGSALVIDIGNAQETVTVTASTATTFTATTLNPHDGTVRPFPIVGKPIVGEALPNIGQGWLNFLSAPETPDTTILAIGANLRDVLTALLDYARIKQALSPNDERLLAVLQNPAPVPPNNKLPLVALTGWDQSSLKALLDRINMQPADLSLVENLRRVYDAYAFVKACRISAPVLISVTTNAPSATTVAALQSALRALYAESDWLAIVRPINDAMRIRQRDALVAYILQQLSDNPKTADINTADKLFEFFLIDVETQPPVDTSRIRLALSSVQLFIERILRNLEPQVSPNDIDGSLWPWMKRYRVWQANREVFLWPENWLYPELRDDQSPFFQETMSALLQSDITDDAAANAHLDYLTKLEPCGLYYVPESSDANEISYVVARTAGAHRKYYFRKLENASWTPWEEIKLQIEDTPVAPFVWNNRLLLFWLKILKQSSLDPNNLPAPSNDVSNIGGAALSALQSAATSSAGTATQVNVQAMLSWSEFYNGKWQPTKTSDQNRPTLIGIFDASGQNAFDPKKYQMQIASYSADKLVVSVTACGNPFGSDPPGFLLYNTHSTPLALEDVADNPNWGAIAWRSMSTSYPGSGGGINPNIAYPPPASPNTFSISYVKMEAIPFPHQVLAYSNDILTSPVGERVVLTQPVSGIAVAWNLPFFFEDSRNMFYVTTSQALVPIHFYLGYGILPGAISLSAVAGAISGLALPQRPKPVVRFTPNVSPTNPPLADLAQMQRFVTEDAHIHASMATAASVSFQGQQIGPRGRLTGVRQTQSK